MKGVELPISTIVVIVLVLIVLLAVIGLFFGVWNPGTVGITLESAKNNACQILISTGCGDPILISTGTFDVGDDDDPANDNLQGLCESYYAISDPNECKVQVCHCE